MFEIATNNLDKIGLILNIIGTLFVAFSFGSHKDDRTQVGIGYGKPLKPSYFKSPKKFHWGIGFLITGFIFQLVG